MSSVDNRIVNLQFNNKSFESNVKDTQKTLAGLEKSLQLQDGTKGLDNVEKASRDFSMASVGDAIESIADRFSTLGIIGMTALQNLTNSAIDLGKRLVGAIYDPLVEGGKQRALNIEQAKFQFEGLGIDVEKAMAAASYAVNDTAYSLDAAAKAAGSFAASGLEDFDEMGTALRAISGVAAQTNSSYEDIANVFTTVAGNGRLMGQQLLQLSGRGLNAAATLAKSLGKSEAEVRKMVSAGKIDFKTFYEAMDEAFGEHAKKANETFSGSMSNVRANLSRIGADVATASFENFKNVNNALIPVLKELHKALGPAIDGVNQFQTLVANFAIDKINNVDFKWLTDSIPAGIGVIKNLGVALLSIAKPVGKAYRNIFPAATAQSFLDAANALKALTANFKLSDEAAKNLERTFSGVFAILNIGKRAFLALGEGILGVIRYLAPAGSGILSFTGSIGDMLVALDKAIGQSNLFSKAIEKLGNIVRPAADVVKTAFEGIIAAIKSFVTFDTSPLSEFATTAAERFKPLLKVSSAIETVFMGIAGGLKKVIDFLSPAAKVIGQSLGELKTRIAESLSEGNFAPLFDLVNGGLFAGILVGVGNFVKAMTKVAKSGGLVSNLNKLLTGVSSALSAFTGAIKAEALKKIATAVAILAAALLVLSLVPSESLTGSLTAISILMTELFASMAIFEKIMGSAGFAKMGKISAAMIALSAAVLVLSFALKNLAKLDWDGLAKGLLGVAGLSATLVASAKVLSSNTSKLIKGALGLVVFSAAVLVLTKAVKNLSLLDWESLGKGLAGTAAIMAELVAFSKLVDKMGVGSSVALLVLSAALLVFVNVVKKLGGIDKDAIIQGIVALGAILTELGLFTKLAGGTKNMISIGIGITLLAAAMHILHGALVKMAAMSWDEIGRGLTVLAGSLGALTLALNFLPKNMVAIGLGFVGVAAGLVLLSNALTTMGGMSWEEIAKGLVTLAGSLTILAVALIAMTGTLAGAAALLIASAALLVLTGALFLLGSIPIETLVAGLAALAVVLGLLGIAGLVLGPVALGMLAFAAAMLLVGASILAAGVGLVALAAGLGMLGAVGLETIPILAGLLTALAIFGALSPLILALGVALIAFGVAVGILAIGLIALSAAFTLLGVSTAIGIDALYQLADAVVDLSQWTLDFLALGAALLVFGAGAAVGAVGMLALSIGVLALGAGMLVLAKAGPDGIQALEDIAGVSLKLLLATPALLTTGAALGVFGVGALAAGAGALAAGAGFILLNSGLDAFKAIGPEASKALKQITDLSADMLVLTPIVLAMSAAMLALGAAGLVGGAGALVAGAGMLVMGEGLASLAKVQATALESVTSVVEASKVLSKSAVGMAAAGAALLVLGTGAVALGAGLHAIGSGAESMTTAAQALTKLTDVFKTTLKETTNQSNEIVKVIKQMTDDIGKELQNAKPRLETQTKAMISKGVTSAIQSQTPNAVNVTISLANALLSAMRDNTGQWHPIGVNYVDGFISGLSSKIGEAVATAQSLANSTSQAVNSSLRIKSPSRVGMESGGFFGEGFIIGIHPYVALAAEMGEEVGESAMNSLNSTLDEAVAEINLDTNPVIRPVLDLDQALEEKKKLDALFGITGTGPSSLTTRAAMAAASRRAAETSKDVPQTTKIENTYQLTQNNNSPKALSRLDIYRDTKNLFGLLKETVDV